MRHRLSQGDEVLHDDINPQANYTTEGYFSPLLTASPFHISQLSGFIVLYIIILCYVNKILID